LNLRNDFRIFLMGRFTPPPPKNRLPKSTSGGAEAGGPEGEGARGGGGAGGADALEARGGGRARGRGL